MSTNISITRVCKFCGNPFTAKTTVTSFCSHRCSSRAYKARKKSGKIEKSNLETASILQNPSEKQFSKEYLTITDTCELLSISRWTLWRLIKGKKLTAGKVGKHVLVRKSDIEKLFHSPKVSQEPNRKIEETEYSLEECLSVKESVNLYNISREALYDLVKREQIPSIRKWRYMYLPKEILDKHLKSVL